MAEKAIDPAQYIERAAEIMGVPLSGERLPGIIANFENFLALYRTVQGVETPECPDPLGVFRP